MKKYEKPQLMFLSLSGNDQLCGTCSDNHRMTINDNPIYQELILDARPEIDEDHDGILDRDEFHNCFGTTEKECADTDHHIDNYCKFTSNTTLVAWS